MGVLQRGLPFHIHTRLMKRSILFISSAVGLLLLSGLLLPLGWVYTYPRVWAALSAVVLALVVYIWLGRMYTCREVISLLRGRQVDTPAPDLITVLISILTAVLTYLGMMTTYSYRVDYGLKTRGVVTEAHLKSGTLRQLKQIHAMEEPQMLTYSYVDSLTGLEHSLRVSDHAFLHGLHGSGLHIHVVYLPGEAVVVKPLIERKDIEVYMGQSIRALQLAQLADLLDKDLEDIEAYLCSISYGWERTEGDEEKSLYNRYTGEVIQRHCHKILYQSEQALDLLGATTELEVDDQLREHPQNPCRGRESQQFVYDGRVHIYLEEDTSILHGKVQHIHKLHLFPLEDSSAQ